MKVKAPRNREYGRKNNYKKTRKDINLVIKTLEETGKLIDYLSPPHINDRLVQLYFRILKCEDLLASNRLNDCRKNIVSAKRKDYIRRFLNLSSIIIGSVLARWRTMGEYYEDMYNDCVVAILTMIRKRKYVHGKSAMTSFIYETCRQAIHGKCVSEIDRLNKTLKLIEI